MSRHLEESTKEERVGNEIPPFVEELPLDECHWNSKRPLSWWKWKLMSLYISMFMLGFVMSLHGPALLDMTEYLNTDVKTISMVTSIGAAGGFVGVILSGLLSRKVYPELHLLANVLWIGAATAIMPWAGPLTVYGFFYTLLSFGIGLFEPLFMAYPLQVMRRSKMRDPAEQAVHASWSAGAFTGPFITGLFLSSNDTLSEKIEGKNETITEGMYTRANTYLYIKANTSTDLNLTLHYSNTTTSNEELMVPYAYLTSGFAMIVSAIPPLIILLIGPRTSKQIVEASRVKQEHKSRIHIAVMLFYSLWCCLYIWCEHLPALFMPAFVVTHLGWSRYEGALISSTLFGAHTLGRLISVPISAKLSSGRMITSSLTLTFLAYLMLLLLHPMDPMVVWVSIALAGVGMSCFYGAGILWISTFIDVTNFEASIFAFGAAVGTSSGSAFTGYMFEMYSPLWLLHIILGATILSILIYITLYLIRKLCLHS